MTFRVLATFAVTLLVSLPSPTMAGDPATEKSGTNAVAATVQGQSANIQLAARGTDQGIKVHGHWTIEVKSPEGKIIQRYEFTNSLMPGGKDVLMNLLAGGVIQRWWGVLVGSTPAGSGLCNNSGNNACHLVEPDFSWTASNLSKTLTVTPNFTAGILSLSGSFTATQDADLGYVTTTFFGCPTSTPTCTPSFGQTFTSKALIPAISVQNGQLIAITVRLSFS
jgi:hypothetical protein